jgi:hypothetical protein
MAEVTFVCIDGFPAHRVEAARAVLSRLHRSMRRVGTSGSAEIHDDGAIGGAATVAPTIEIARRRIEARCQISGLVLGVEDRVCSARHVGRPCALRRRWVVDLEVQFDRPIVGAWEVIGRIEAIAWGSDNLIHVVLGASVADGELARWRTGAVGCDHCGVDRERSDVIVLRALDDAVAPRGTLRGVGRTCLEVLTGVADAGSVLARIGWPAQVWQAGDDGHDGWGAESAVYAVEEIVTVAAAIIRVDGYVSRAKARESSQGVAATADRVLRVVGHVSILEGTSAPSRGDVDAAQQAILWALGEDESDRSDYRNNLRVLAGADHVGAEHVGVLASLVVAYDRALGDRALRGPSAPLGAGAHVGAVGEVIELDVVIERRSRVGTTQGRWGMVCLVRMRDEAGRSIVWRTTSDAAGEEGGRVRIRGRVRAHSIYRGEMQTELTRCRIVRVAKAQGSIDLPGVPREDDVD